MFTCKQVSKTLECTNYEDLSALQKALLRFHISLCIVCGKYNTQVVGMQKLSRCFCQQEKLNEDLHLTDEEKLKLKQTLAAADEAA